MTRTRASGATGESQAWLPRYLGVSKKPLTILAFLLPLVVAYEIGLAFALRSSQGVLTNKAHVTLLRFFDTFGISAGGGLYLGGAVLVVVLLVWHMLNRDPWRLEPATPGLMAVESLMVTIPLIVLAQVILRNSAGSQPVPATPVVDPTALGSLSIWSKLAISIGAGLYEELLFRMLLIAVLHTLLVDVGKLNSTLGAVIAIIVSASAFTIYHPPAGLGSGMFYFVAGLYFGGVYVIRGFGIVVGVHAIYDIIMVSMLPS
ncbi:MAG: CPBP family intramembrane glutamic endopeptidase [Phycisphaerales bacterium]